MASLTTLSAVLKEFYLGPIVNQLNNEILAIELFQKAQVDWQGKKVVIPVKVGRNSGVGFAAEGGQLPTAGSQQYADLLVEARYSYGRFTVTGQSIAASKTSAGAFVQAMDSEMSGLVEDVKNMCNRAAFTGGSVIGYVWEKANQATFQYAGATTCADGSAFTLGAADTTARLVRLDTYAFVGAATQVNAVTEQNITFNAAIDTSAVPSGVVLAVVITGDKLTGSKLKYNSPGAYDLEPAGMQMNLSSPVHFGIDRTTATGTATELQSVHVLADPSADAFASLSLASIERALNKVNLASGKKPDIIICNDLLRVEYTSLLQGTGSQNLFVPTDKSTDGYAGFDRIFYMGLEIKSSRHAPKGTFFLLSSKVSWKLAVLGDLGFMDEDGNVLFRLPTDGYEGTAKWYYNVVCTEPHANAVLTGVSFLA